MRLNDTAIKLIHEIFNAINTEMGGGPKEISPSFRRETLIGLDYKRDEISRNTRYPTLYFQGDNIMKQGIGHSIKASLSNDFMAPPVRKMGM